MNRNFQTKRDEILQALIAGAFEINYATEEDVQETSRTGMRTMKPKYSAPEVRVGGHDSREVAKEFEKMMEEVAGLRDELRETKAALSRAEDINRELTGREKMDG